MADTATFEEFVTTRSAYLLRTAFALTRDHTNAEDLLQTALARSWPAWSRIGEDPEPYVRQVMVNTYRSWWRRKWNGERPTDELPEVSGRTPQSSVDDRDEVWRALQRLPKKQQAVLVLRYFEDLSEADIASILDMAPGTVKSYASRGLAAMRVDPGLLDKLEVPEPPAGVERVAAVKQRITQHRQNRIVTMATAFIGVLCLVIGFSLSPLRNSMPPLTPGGFPEYSQGYHVVADKQISYIQSGATFTWTPSTWDIAFFAMCAHNTRDVMVSLKAQINGRTLTDIPCIDSQPMTPVIAATATRGTLESAGVELGRQVEVKIIVDEPLKTSGVDIDWETADSVPTDGTAAIGIGEQMAFEDFPLPRRPRQLISLEPYRNLAADSVLESVLDSNRTSIMVVGGTHHVFKMRSQTPGQIIISMQGVATHTVSWWDYSAEEQVIEVQATGEGGLVTITLTAKHITGDWFAAV